MGLRARDGAGEGHAPGLRAGARHGLTLAGLPRLPQRLRVYLACPPQDLDSGP